MSLYIQSKTYQTTIWWLLILILYCSFINHCQCTFMNWKYLIFIWNLQCFKKNGLVQLTLQFLMSLFYIQSEAYQTIIWRSLILTVYYSSINHLWKCHVVILSLTKTSLSSVNAISTFHLIYILDCSSINHLWSFVISNQNIYKTPICHLNFSTHSTLGSCLLFLHSKKQIGFILMFNNSNHLITMFGHLQSIKVKNRYKSFKLESTNSQQARQCGIHAISHAYKATSVDFFHRQCLQTLF